MQAKVRDNKNRSHGDINGSIYVYKLSMHGIETRNCTAVICLYTYKCIWKTVFMNKKRGKNHGNKNRDVYS